MHDFSSPILISYRVNSTPIISAQAQCIKTLLVQLLVFLILSKSYNTLINNIYK